MLVGSTLRRHPGSAAPAIALAALALVAAGCGSSSKKSSNTSTSSGGTPAPTKTTAAPSGGATVAEAATEYKFAPASATAKSGKVTVKLTNNGQTAHAIEIEKTAKGDVKSSTVPSGQSTTLTATLKPGKYEFYCPIDGHKKLGMTGTLTVK